MESASRMLPARTAAFVLCAPDRSSPTSQAGGMAAGALFPPAADAASDARWQDAWTTRAERLELIRDAPSDEQKLWAMRTLAREAEFVQRRFLRSGTPLDEEYGAYYRRLALFVAGLGDDRSIEALAVTTDVSPSVGNALAEFGEAAVEPVIRTLSNPFLRESAAFTLGRILKRANERRIRFAPAVLRAIRRSLAEAVTAGGPSLQRCAAGALGHTKLTPAEIRALRLVERRKDTPSSVRDVLLPLLTQ